MYTFYYYKVSINKNSKDKADSEALKNSDCSMIDSYKSPQKSQ